MELNLDKETILNNELRTKIHGLAIHEGGHWVASELRGITVDRAELAISEKSSGTGTLVWKSLAGTTLEDQGVAIAAGFAAELITFGKEALARKGFGCFKTDSKKLRQLGFTQNDAVRLTSIASELLKENNEKFQDIVKKMEEAITSKILLGEKTLTFRTK